MWSEPLTVGGGVRSVEDARALLTRNRWQLVDAASFTRDPWPYRDYIMQSRAELSVARDLNVRLRSGWFSERSACYLAAGRPVICQDTGLATVLPTGAGLLTFSDADEAVDAINRFLTDRLPQLSAVYVCCHDDADHCDCRKPKPGMLLQAAREHGIDLSRSYMIGDRSGDVVAGAAAGCKTLLIDLPYSKGDRCSPDYRVADLSEAAKVIEGLLNEPRA